MEQYETIDASQRRNYFNRVLKTMVTSHDDVIAAWCAWEPNALDGFDAEYRNTPGSDGTGRYIPYWASSGGSQPTLFPLEGYAQSGAGDYYQIPLRTGKEAVLLQFEAISTGVRVVADQESIVRTAWKNREWEASIYWKRLGW
ncbi:MAG: hypothetical protein LBC51_06550 [Treponema sp.]|jgi:hypothetical protein|nr:hypothetical protein [Treponema sp.]